MHTLNGKLRNFECLFEMLLAFNFRLDSVSRASKSFKILLTGMRTDTSRWDDLYTSIRDKFKTFFPALGLEYNLEYKT